MRTLPTLPSFFPTVQTQPIGGYFLALKPSATGANVSLSFKSISGAHPTFHAVVRHVLTGTVVARRSAFEGNLELSIACQRPQLNYLSQYWNRLDACVAQGTLPPEFHYEVLLFRQPLDESIPLPAVGAWEGPSAPISLELSQSLARIYNPRAAGMEPWDPKTVPDTNPWPIL